MTGLPDLLAEYFASGDALSRADVQRDHPELPELLAAPETRTVLLEWLAGEEPWDVRHAESVSGVLRFLRRQASDADAPRIKPFLLHPNPGVRLAAYEFLTALYYPDINHDALFLLLNGMLMDESDEVRRTGADLVQRVGAPPELRAFLTRWRAMAPARGWEGTASFELITRLLES
jgi:hypothetical protein